MDVEAVIHTLNTAMYTYYRHKNFIVKADQNDATSQHAHIEQKHNELLHGRRRKERKERRKKKHKIVLVSLSNPDSVIAL